MANNRMYLLHIPTGKKLKLGKRMGGGYYDPPTAEQMDAFFSECEDKTERANDLDAFVLEFEIGRETCVK